MSYILNVSLLLTICAVFYRLLLVKETFFKLNRYVLLGCIVLSFLLPMVPVPGQFSFRKARIQQLATSTAAEQSPVAVQTAPSESKAAEVIALPSITLQEVVRKLVWLYWAGVAAFGITFLVQLAILLYRSATLPFIQDGRYRIVEMTGDTAPCSFGNSIYINPEKYDWDTYNQILLHEKIHIRDGHSLDLLLSELVLVFHWFNPFAWMYRKELENNLEFLTDEQLLSHNEVDQESYQLSLLKVSAPHFPLNLTTNYNQSLLKKRLKMMNAKRSSMGTAWKYFFLLPLFLGSVSLFNEPIVNAAPSGKNMLARAEFKTGGTWYGRIKGESISVTSQDDLPGNKSNSTFQITDLEGFPDKDGSFSLSREAGTLSFYGSFKGSQGSGRYTFNPGRDFAAFLQAEGINDLSAADMLAYFFADIDRAFIQMLKDEGYKGFQKSGLIAAATLKVDAAYIEMLRDNGYRNVSLKELAAAKAGKIDAAYIRAVRIAGLTNRTLADLVAYKGQLNTGTNQVVPGNSTIKTSLGAKGDTIKSALRPELKATSKEYNYNDAVTGIARNVNDILTKVKSDLDQAKNSDAKVLTKEDYLTELKDLGYLKPEDETITGLMIAGVSPGYIKGFHRIGFTNQELRTFITLKKLRITPATVQEYRALGFQEVSLKDVIDATSTGATASFVKEMKEKGYNFPALQKYVSLKAEQR